MKRRLLCVVMVVAMALCLAACGGSDSKNAKITSAWSIVEMTVNGKSMTYDDSNRVNPLPVLYYGVQTGMQRHHSFRVRMERILHLQTVERRTREHWKNQVKNTSCITVIRTKRWKRRFPENR